MQASRSSDEEASELVQSIDDYRTVADLEELVFEARDIPAQRVRPVAGHWAIKQPCCNDNKASFQKLRQRRKRPCASVIKSWDHCTKQHVNLSIDLAAILRKQDQKLIAEALLRQAVNAGKRLGHALQHTLSAKMLFASVVCHLGKPEEAIALSREALAVCSRMHGPGHLLTPQEPQEPRAPQIQSGKSLRLIQPPMPIG